MFYLSPLPPLALIEPNQSSTSTASLYIHAQQTYWRLLRCTFNPSRRGRWPRLLLWWHSLPATRLPRKGQSTTTAGNFIRLVLAPPAIASLHSLLFLDCHFLFHIPCLSLYLLWMSCSSVAGNNPSTTASFAQLHYQIRRIKFRFGTRPDVSDATLNVSQSYNINMNRTAVLLHWDKLLCS